MVVHVAFARRDARWPLVSVDGYGVAGSARSVLLHAPDVRFLPGVVRGNVAVACAWWTMMR